MRVISVIMGVYNAENSVERAVRSLYTYTGDMEVIAVNDGSKDGTADKLFRLSEEFPSLKVFSLEENCGLTYCLNFALEKSAGEFVARMDADDICRVGRFEKQLAFLNGHPDYAFTGGGARLFDEKGVYARRSFPAQPQLSDISTREPLYPSHSDVPPRGALKSRRIPRRFRNGALRRLRSRIPPVCGAPVRI